MKREEKALHTAFGRVLAELRADAGLSQQSLAFDCELDRTYISLLERGLRQPTLSTLFKLAETLSVPPSDIVAAVERRTRSRKR